MLPSAFFLAKRKSAWYNRGEEVKELLPDTVRNGGKK